MQAYNTLRTWFNFHYGYLDFKLTPYYVDEVDLKPYFGILYKNNKTTITRISLESLFDFTAFNPDLKKMIFDTLLTSHGYRIDNDFTPIKKFKEFQL